MDDIKIGHHCLIMYNTIIGKKGFGFNYEEDGSSFRIPHICSIEIENYVEIKNLTAIDKGTIKNRSIKSKVKIDNLFILHLIV